MKRFLLVTVVLVMGWGIVFNTGCKKSKTSGPDMSVVDVKWILESIQYSSSNVIPIVETFYIWLKADSRLEMEVDCNYCAGNYTLGDNNSIFFDYSTIACTEADCGENSRDDEFHDALNTASRYEVIGNRLRIYFNSEQSQLNFIAESS